MFSKADAEAYFLEEKQWAMAMSIAGLLSIVLAGICYFVLKSPLAKGISLPLLALGLLFGMVGYGVYSRSDKQRTTIVYNMDMNPDAIAQKELPRMQDVMKRFVWLRHIELFLLAAAVGVFIYLQAYPDKNFWKGIAIGIAIHIAIALLVDYKAEHRARKYFTGLQHWLKS